MIDLPTNELQIDALGEIFNIGVGRAAASLSQIVNDEIELSAPQVRFVAPEEITRYIENADSSPLSVVSQEFSGPFDAQAMLVFPEKNALQIVGHMLGGVVPPEQLGEFEQEAMCEVGNIILNACISALADLLAVEFSGTLPQYHHGQRNSFDLFAGLRADMPVVLLVQIDLIIRQQSVQGHLAFLLSVSSLSALMARIDDYLRSQGLL